MQVLSEHLTFDQAKVVVESSNEGKDLYMKGICIQGNVKNANQRVYPTFEINKAVQKISDTISGGQSVLGEVDHPEDLKINLDRVSHMLTNMYMEGNNGYGKLKILRFICFCFLAVFIYFSGFQAPGPLEMNPWSKINFWKKIKFQKIFNIFSEIPFLVKICHF